MINSNKFSHNPPGGFQKVEFNPSTPYKGGAQSGNLPVYPAISPYQPQQHLKQRQEKFMFASQNSNEISNAFQQKNIDVPSIYRVPQDFRQELQNVNQNSYMITDMERIIEAERLKHQEYKREVEINLENERRQRIDLDNKLIKLKDDHLKREMLLSEMDFKMNNLAHENSSLNAENFQLKEEFAKMQDAFQNRLRELEEKVVYHQNEYMQQEDFYQREISKKDFNYQNTLENMQKDFEQQFLNNQEKINLLLQNKKSSDNDLRLMQENFQKLKIKADEEVREVTARIQEEEYKKWMSALKMIEGKLRSSEEARDATSRKIQDLQRDFQLKEKKNQEQIYEYELNINALRNELCNYLKMNMTNLMLADYFYDLNFLTLGDLQNQQNQLQILMDQQKHELQGKQQIIMRLESETMEYQKMNMKQREQLKQEMDRNNQELNNEIRYLIDVKDQQNKRILELEGIITLKERDFMNLNQEYERITNSLQNNIQKTILNTFQETQILKNQQFGFSQMQNIQNINKSNLSNLQSNSKSELNRPAEQRGFINKY